MGMRIIIVYSHCVREARIRGKLWLKVSRLKARAELGLRPVWGSLVAWHLLLLRCLCQVKSWSVWFMLDAYPSSTGGKSTIGVRIEGNVSPSTPRFCASEMVLNGWKQEQGFLALEPWAGWALVLEISISDSWGCKVGETMRTQEAPLALGLESTWHSSPHQGLCRSLGFWRVP